MGRDVACAISCDLKCVDLPYGLFFSISDSTDPH